MKNIDTNNIQTVELIEYKMPKSVAASYLKERKGDDKKLQNNAYLCKIVNEQYGLKGYCTRVITF